MLVYFAQITGKHFLESEIRTFKKKPIAVSKLEVEMSPRKKKLFFQKRSLLTFLRIGTDNIFGFRALQLLEGIQPLLRQDQTDSLEICDKLKGADTPDYFPLYTALPTSYSDYFVGVLWAHLTTIHTRIFLYFAYLQG